MKEYGHYLSMLLALNVLLFVFIGCPISGSRTPFETSVGGGDGVQKPEGNKKIFITASSYTGNLSGVSGADSKCSSDSNKPSTGTYKAMIVDGSNRRACFGSDCGNASDAIDWVLGANVTYARASDESIIGTTTSIGLSKTAGTFPFSLTSAFTTTSSALVWTGLTSLWFVS